MHQKESDKNGVKIRNGADRKCIGTGTRTRTQTGFGQLGARLAKAILFWSMAAGLGYSSLQSVEKINDAVRTSAAENAPNTTTTNPGQENAPNTMTANPGQENAPNTMTANPGQENAPNTIADNSDQNNAIAGNSNQDSTNEQNTILISKEQKTVALTFDDGPHPVYTKKLLDGLRERQVHVTFFVVGKNIPGNEALIEQMKEDGHLIGNHTYDHVKICDLSSEEACEQVEKTSELVYEITGEKTEFVRPPFGAWNKNMECSFVMLPVLWDVDPLDWTTRNTSVIVQRVLDEVESGDIVLLHDYYDSSVEAAFQIVDELLSEGYEFVTADEMLLE